MTLSTNEKLSEGNLEQIAERPVQAAERVGRPRVLLRQKNSPAVLEPEATERKAPSVGRRIYGFRSMQRDVSGLEKISTVILRPSVGRRIPRTLASRRRPSLSGQETSFFRKGEGSGCPTLVGPILAHRVGLLLLALCLFPFALSAHVGSPDVYFESAAGPYRILTVVRMPQVVPGVADIEVRVLSGSVQSVRVVPMRIQGQGAELAPVPDVATPVAGSPDVFRASLWIMMRGAWKVDVELTGEQGTAKVGVPIAATAIIQRPMTRAMGMLLAALGVLLFAGLLAIIGAAFREAKLPPGAPLPVRATRHARWAMLAAAVILVTIVSLGNLWWSVEAGDNARTLYRLPRMNALLRPPATLVLQLRNPNGGGWAERIRLDDLVPDHGHLVHLFLVREPALDALAHLHPQRADANHLVFMVDGQPESTAGSRFTQSLPPLPAGKYRLFADIVHGTGFPETQVAELDLPAVPAASGPLDPDDTAWTISGRVDTGDSPVSGAPPLSRPTLAGQGGNVLWLDEKTPLRVNEPLRLRFRVLDSSGQPASDLEAYMGMAGHLVVLRDDFSVFAHLHPAGSVPMAAVDLANRAASHNMVHAIDPEISFPYGFPQPGHYRLFLQYKRAGRVHTAAFDATVN